MTDPGSRAARWLEQTYRGRVGLSTAEPVAETPGTWLFACRVNPSPGEGKTVMLNATLAVPKNASTPFHPATDDPGSDVATFDADPAPREATAQARRTNARGCVLAAHAALSGVQASPLPWKPEDEAPGWWERLVRQFSPDATVASCEDWDEVVAEVGAHGPDARGVVWVRRELGGKEASGHLLYGHNNDGRVALLDPSVGRLGRLERQGVRKLTVAVTHGPAPSAPASSPKPLSASAAEGFAAAVAKAEAWLSEVYGGDVVLLAPSPADEGSRGWLFACNTKSFADTGGWQDGMLDAALVVPKRPTVPFPLPNSAPWDWLRQWQAGTTPPTPVPTPGPAAWLNGTMRRLGGVVSASTHADWQSLTAELASFPEGSRAVVWLRRSDPQGRESVGLLLNGVCTENGIALLDSTTGESARLETEGVRALHLVRYR
ncbi:YrhB domain-containing protein [Streptomyces phytophilus]|uniref:YrhB domain-containing protein n=1 Tax=Streptomyces phytophilus TaxID=722715 RepID=UPI0015F05166|nr:YrhB domain-containing protein [Streptomyces phytophilus]